MVASFSFLFFFLVRVHLEIPAFYLGRFFKVCFLEEFSFFALCFRYFLGIIT